MRIVGRRVAGRNGIYCAIKKYILSSSAYTIVPSFILSQRWNDNNYEITVTVCVWHSRPGQWSCQYLRFCDSVWWAISLPYSSKWVVWVRKNMLQSHISAALMGHIEVLGALLLQFHKMSFTTTAEFYDHWKTASLPPSSSSAILMMAVASGCPKNSWSASQ